MIKNKKNQRHDLVFATAELKREELLFGVLENYVMN